MSDTTRLHAAGRLAAAFIESKLTPLFVAGSVLLGVSPSSSSPARRSPRSSFR
jgi:hypothetical protein